MNEQDFTFGKFVTKKITGPATVVDCSSWLDTSTGDWTFGTFVTKKKTSPAIPVKLHLPALRLEVFPLPGATLQELQKLTAALIQILSDAAPDLNIELDSTRSQLDEDSQGTPVAVLVLVAQTPPADIDQRYGDLIVLAREEANRQKARLVESLV